MPTPAPIQREVGSAPISIGTSLAMESLCGFGEFPNQKPPLHQYTELWINLRTLFRNLKGALSPADQRQISQELLVNYLLGDMLAIIATVVHTSQSPFPILFYRSTFKSLSQQFPLAQHKQLKTDLQKAYAQDEEAVLHRVQCHGEILSEHTHVRSLSCDVALKRPKHFGNPTQSLLLTHLPIDFLSPGISHRLTLLESHTGVFKKRAEWYTKLTGGKQLTRIPFNRMTLQVFGDNSNLFYGMSPKIKTAVNEMAEQDKWTPVTTDERVRASIMKRYDPREKTFFLKLLTG